MSTIINFTESLIFRNRLIVIFIFLIATLFLIYQASQLKLAAGFTKNIPLTHEYMRNYMKHAKDFGGANNVLVSVCDKDGDIFNAAFFNTLKEVHDQLFFINGVDRSLVKSLFSSSTRFTEIVEGGFAGGPGSATRARDKKSVADRTSRWWDCGRLRRAGVSQEDGCEHQRRGAGGC